VKERRKTIPPKLKRISEEINAAIQEAKKIRELTVQEEVVQELDKVYASPRRSKERDCENNESLVSFASHEGTKGACRFEPSAKSFWS
jgi:hypothetical protein